MVSVIAVVLVLGGIIFFHELGHFIVARIFKVGVKTFSLGFGPRLAGFRHHKTDYRIAAVPLGGYVSMVGDQPDSELPEGFTDSERFMSKAPWKRMLIVAAGPGFNFVLAFVLYWILLVAYGQLALTPCIGEIRQDTPAASSGLAPGDCIVAVDETPIRFWDDFVELVRDSGGSELAITVRRDGREKTFLMAAEQKEHKNIFGEKITVPMIGVVASGETTIIEVGPGEAVTGAAEQTWRMVSLTVQGLVKLVERIIPLETIGGPIMIAQLVSNQAKQGLANVLALAALISVNLGLINLLPIPVLDGGHILFFAIETVTGRRLPPRWQSFTIKIGLAFLLLLMAFAIYNDLQRIIAN